MTLSENIRRFRLEKNLTQEALAALIGVSAQAVSKWETSETYPDGALMLPLAKALGRSLDALFGNEAVSMPDLSEEIVRYLHKIEQNNRLKAAQEICWQIQKGLFGPVPGLDLTYVPGELEEKAKPSYILRDDGFSHATCNAEPFFFLSSEPMEGYGDFAVDLDEITACLAALGRAATAKASLFLMKQTLPYLFDPAILPREIGISEEEIESVVEDLVRLRLVWNETVIIDGEKKRICRARHAHLVLALWLMARQIGHRGGYQLQTEWREKGMVRDET